MKTYSVEVVVDNLTFEVEYAYVGYPYVGYEFDVQSVNYVSGLDPEDEVTMGNDWLESEYYELCAKKAKEQIEGK